MNITFLKTGVVPFLIALFMAYFIGRILIPLLTKKKVDQTERDIMESHVKKTGTPTMGGFIFLIPAVVVGIFFAGEYPNIIPVMIGTVAFGLIGFFDDFLKVILKRTDGLKAWQKFTLQFAAATLLYVYIRYYSTISFDILLPFSGASYVDIEIFAIPLFYFAVLGTVNGVNFTDGIDGLASSVTIVVCGFFFVSSCLLSGGIEPACAAMAGALLAFLFFNVNPAKIFMGDTGSLALGGFVASCAYAMNMPIFIIVVGIIYLVEVISVILQVGFFKLTHGKRLFRMAPIHHHFELGGWSEPKIVAVFSGITLILSLIALTAF